MANRYNQPAEQPIMNTYVPLPYQELMQAGLSKQKSQDAARASALEIGDKQFNFLTKDLERAQAARKELDMGAEELANMDLTSREGRRKLNEYIKGAKKRFSQFGDIGAMQANYNARANAYEEAQKRFAKGDITQDQLSKVFAGLDSAYQGIGEGDNGSFNKYNIENIAKYVDYTDWANKYGKDIESHLNAAAYSKIGNDGYIREGKNATDVLTKDEIRNVLSQYAGGSDELLNYMSQGLKYGYTSPEKLKNAVEAAAEKYDKNNVTAASQTTKSDTSYWKAKEEKKDNFMLQGNTVLIDDTVDPNNIKNIFDIKNGDLAAAYRKETLGNSKYELLKAGNDLYAQKQELKKLQAQFDTEGSITGYDNAEESSKRLQYLQSNIQQAEADLNERRTQVLNQEKHINQIEEFAFQDNGMTRSHYEGLIEQAKELKSKIEQSKANNAKAIESAYTASGYGEAPKQEHTYMEELQLAAIEAELDKVEASKDIRSEEAMAPTAQWNTKLVNDTQNKMLEKAGLFNEMKASPYEYMNNIKVLGNGSNSNRYSKPSNPDELAKKIKNAVELKATSVVEKDGNMIAIKGKVEKDKGLLSTNKAKEYETFEFVFEPKDINRGQYAQLFYPIGEDGSVPVQHQDMLDPGFARTLEDAIVNTTVQKTSKRIKVAGENITLAKHGENAFSITGPDGTTIPIQYRDPETGQVSEKSIVSPTEVMDFLKDINYRFNTGQ